MMSGVVATPTRSPGASGAFSQRFALGGQGEDIGPPWPQSGAPPPGIPTSFGIAVGDTPPTRDATDMEVLKTQVAAALTGLQFLSEQVQKLLATAEVQPRGGAGEYESVHAPDASA